MYETGPSAAAQKPTAQDLVDKLDAAEMPKHDKRSPSEYVTTGIEKATEKVKTPDNVVQRHQESARQRLTRIKSLQQQGNHKTRISTESSCQIQGDPLSISRDLDDSGVLPIGGSSSYEDAELKQKLDENRIPEEHPDSPHDRFMKTTAEVSQFEVQSSNTPDGKVNVVVIDRLNPDKPIVTNVKFERQDRAQAIKEIERTLKKEIPRRQQAAEKLLQSDKIKAEPMPEPAMELDKSQKISPKALKELQQLLGTDGHMEVLVVPPGHNVEEPVRIRIDSYTIEKMGEHPIKIKGQILGILVERERTVESQPNLGSKLTTDKEGNVVGTEVKKTGTQDGKIVSLETITIQPATPLASQKGQSNEVKCDLDFRTHDGTRIEIKGLLTQQEIPKVGKVGPYDLHSNLTPEQIKENEIRIKELARGIAKAEKMFGLKPGSVVKSINLEDLNSANAYVRLNDASTVNIGDESMQQNPAEVGYHETIHCIDMAAGGKPLEFGLSSEKFKDQFKNLEKNNAEFLTKINESRFLVGMNPKAGHAHDHPTELLASFANSLNHPQWEQTMSQAPQKFKDDYLKTLNAFEKTLNNSDIIPKDAPIFKEIEKKRQFLRQPGATPAKV